MTSIKGIGVYFPEQVRHNTAWPPDFGAKLAPSGDRLFNDIPNATDDAATITDRFLAEEANDPFLGVRERRVAPETLTSIEAESLAAQRALLDAGVDGSDLDVIISYSVTPERPTPASACALSERLGATSALAFGMDAACATALVQLETAQALIATGRAKNVLLTQSHLLLRAFPMLHPASPGLGDAATAIVLSKDGRWPILSTYSTTHGEFHEAVTWVRGEGESTDTPWWQAGAGFRIGSRNRAAAKALQRDTVSYAAQTIKRLFWGAGIDVERLDLLASVEPRGWVPRAAAQVLGLPETVVTSVYETRGHLGACGPIANLEAAYRSGRTDRGQLAALYAQGAGFTRAGVLLRLDLPAGPH